MFNRCRCGSETDLRTGFRGDVLQDFRPDAGVEQDVGDPTGTKRFVAAIAEGQRVGELTEDAATQPVVAVDRADTGCGQHTTQPHCFFHDKCADAAACRLHGGSGPSCPASYHHDIIGLRTGSQDHCRQGQCAYLPVAFSVCHDGKRVRKP